MRATRRAQKKKRKRQQIIFYSVGPAAAQKINTASRALRAKKKRVCSYIRTHMNSSLNQSVIHERLFFYFFNAVYEKLAVRWKVKKKKKKEYRRARGAVVYQTIPNCPVKSSAENGL